MKKRLTYKKFNYIVGLIEFVNRNSISQEDIQKIHIDKYNIILIYWN
jgi:hypothetical protein